MTLKYYLPGVETDSHDTYLILAAEIVIPALVMRLRMLDQKEGQGARDTGQDKGQETRGAGHGKLGQETRGTGRGKRIGYNV